MQMPTVGAPLVSNHRTSSTFQRLKQRRAAGEINGFTLIELLVVIVVLGILAAVVIFALTGVTGQSAQAACAADGNTVSTAMAAFTTQNPGAAITTAGLTSGTSANGNNPYIQTWPSNDPHYAFSLSGGTLMIAVPSGSTPVAYIGPSSCSTAA
jgi:prepilin-type N-terminal cleavage/methylation domain-containing protein